MSDYRASKASIKVDNRIVARCVGDNAFANEDRARMFVTMLNEHQGLLRRATQLEIALADLLASIDKRELLVNNPTLTRARELIEGVAA